MVYNDGVAHTQVGSQSGGAQTTAARALLISHGFFSSADGWMRREPAAATGAHGGGRVESSLRSLLREYGGGRLPPLLLAAEGLRGATARLRACFRGGALGVGGAWSEQFADYRDRGFVFS